MRHIIIDSHKSITIPDSRRDEYEDLLALLKDSLSVPMSEGGQVAEWVAVSCLGENHLWQDMGLRGRGELSALIDSYFRPLFKANIHDMKWKKFFYKQICAREGFTLCKSPSCGECMDYLNCFGPEAPETGDSERGRERLR